LFSCDFCLSHGERDAGSSTYRHHLESLGSERRTLTSTKAMALSDLADTDLARKGVKQWSPIFELDEIGFDVFEGTPVEPMHNQVIMDLNRILLVFFS